MLIVRKTSKRIALRLVHKLAMEIIKETSGCKSITDKGCATAMSIGKHYWSKSYIDHDFCLTTMTVLLLNAMIKMKLLNIRIMIKLIKQK